MKTDNSFFSKNYEFVLINKQGRRGIFELNINVVKH